MCQPFYLEKKVFIFQLAKKIVNLYTFYCLCYNFLPISKNKLIGRVFIKGNSTYIITFVISYTFTFAIIPALFGDIYANVNLQKATKLALKLFIEGQVYA